MALENPLTLPASASDRLTDWLLKGCGAEMLASLQSGIAQTEALTTTSYQGADPPSFNVAPSSYLKAVTVHIGVL
jgi:hypothetical protein